MKNFLLVLAGSVAIAGAAAAADLPAHTYTKAPVIAPPLYSWTGCYIGANAGGGWDRESVTDNTIDFDLGSYRAGGAIGGGQIGCDYQAGNWVLGAQGLFDAAAFAGSNHVVPAPTSRQSGNVLDVSSKTSWTATATARLGYAIDPQLLLYARGGAAWMRSGTTFAQTGMGITNTFTGAETRTGWTVGAGLEYLVAANWSVFAEYNHMDFGSGTLNTRAADPTIFPQLIQASRTVDAVTVGLNFRLGPSGH